MLDRGTGVPIVFLHAGSGNSGLWRDQVESFSAAGYRCIAYDRRGPAAAADELEALASQLGLERFHVVGTAAGGIAAIDYALSYPKRLRSLVIANSIFGVQDEAYVALMRRLRPSPQFDALPVEVRELGPCYRAADPEGTRRWAEASRHATPQPTRNRITFAALATIRTPALLLTGDGDLYMPPSLLREVATHFKGATSVVVPECGHSAYWEQPEIFRKAVLDFLSGHET